ncbi:MAG: tetratricopeptide repeat protein [Thiohalomonadales bacterium]
MSLSSAKLQKLFSKAVKKHKAGKHREAESLYKKILQDNQSHADSNCMLGTLYAEGGNTNSALKYLLLANNLRDDWYLVKNNLGNVYKMRGDYELAHSYYQQAINLAPENIAAYNNLAIVCKRQQKIGAAIDLYRKAISLKSDFLEAHYNLGKLYSDADDRPNAYACYQRVLEIDENYAPAYNQLGDYYRAEQDHGKAIDCYQSCLQLLEIDHLGVGIKLALLNEGKIPERSPAHLIVDSYESKASTWDSDVKRATMEFLGPQIIKEELDALYTDQASPTELRILDLGCGTGLCGDYLAPLSNQLDGVDLSPHMLRIAEQKGQYTHLYCEEIEAYLQACNTKYELITASGVMIFFGDLNGIHIKIRDCLTAGGLFVFTTYFSHDDDINIRNNLHFSHSERHLRRCAQQNSLEIMSIREVVHEYDFGAAQKGFVVALKRH